jgi:hypothetical protein
VLPDFRRTLLNFRTEPKTGQLRWEIPESQPIRTIKSHGAFERGGRKGITVYGTVSTLWVINTDIHDPQRKTFILSGNASTKIRVFQFYNESRGDQEIARWRFEIGAHDSPGCHFHTPVLQDREDEMFPHRLSIPRLPSLLLTPTDALDFLLGELFQDTWYRIATQPRNNDLGLWASHQRKRLRNLLQWKLDMVERTGGSPWMVLKREKPTDVNMLLVDRGQDK